MYPPAPRATRLWDNILSIQSSKNLSMILAFSPKFKYDSTFRSFQPSVLSSNMNPSILRAFSPKFKYESFDPSSLQPQVQE